MNGLFNVYKTELINHLLVIVITENILLITFNYEKKGMTAVQRNLWDRIGEEFPCH